MPDKLNIVEVDRRSVELRNESDRLRDERARLDRQFAAILNGRKRDWERGFAAALDMIAQQEERKFARGTRDFGDEDTAPYPIIDPATLEVD